MFELIERPQPGSDAAREGEGPRRLHRCQGLAEMEAFAVKCKRRPGYEREIRHRPAAPVSGPGAA